MHPARLSFLAGKHAPLCKIVQRERTADGSWRLTLACGNEGACVAHFDCSSTDAWRCHPCGKAYVLTAPQYASEF